MSVIVLLRHSAMTHVHVPSLQIHMLLQPNSRHWLTALAERKVLIATASVTPYLRLGHNTRSRVIARKDLNNDDSAAEAVDRPYT